MRKHVKVLQGAGLVTRSREAQRRPVHLDAEVLALMTDWVELHRRRAEARMARLEAVLGHPRPQDPEHTTTGADR